MRQRFGICRIEGTHKISIRGHCLFSMKIQSTNSPQYGMNG
jgi:hypothetical protein